MRAISFNVWSNTVDRWNKASHADQLDRIATCCAKGHDPAMSPVGPLCCRCLRYFPDDAAAEMSVDTRSTFTEPIRISTEHELSKSRDAMRRRRAKIAADPEQYAAYRAAETARTRERRAKGATA